MKLWITMAFNECEWEEQPLKSSSSTKNKFYQKKNWTDAQWSERAYTKPSPFIEIEVRALKIHGRGMGGSWREETFSYSTASVRIIKIYVFYDYVNVTLLANVVF